MEKDLYEKLMNDTENLRILVGQCSSESVIGWVLVQLFQWPHKNIGLSSPYKQLFFMLGLFLTTPEPVNPEEFNEARWIKAKKLLEDIFYAYAWMFWPTSEDVNKIDADWYRVREIAMPAFLQYFNSGLLASTKQVKERIKRYLVPMDDQVQKMEGITVSNMLKIADRVANIIQGDYGKFADSRRREEYARTSLLKRAQNENWDFERIHSEANSDYYRKHFNNFIVTISKIGKIELKELTDIAGKVLAIRFWRIFSTKRGSVESFIYLTENNPAEDKPIFLLNAVTALIPSVHSIYLAILKVVEYKLLQSEFRNSYLRHRDKVLQTEIEALLKVFFGDKALIIQSPYETSDQQYEHDIIVKWNRKVFVVEAKATPPMEPFRDPKKASIRIQRAFRSDTGIQKAYYQAHRIEDAYYNGNVVRLFNRKGELILEISKSNTDRIYCICVTRDNFGMLASDLSILLQKESEYPYPWAVNVLDLESLFDAWTYFGWGVDRFCEYIEGRERMHGRVFASDELEYAGFLIEHGTFDYMFEKKYNSIQILPSYTEVFNRIHTAKNGGPTVRYNPYPPCISRLSEKLYVMKGKSINFENESDCSEATFAKQGRNELCACGSGKKFKKCCGKLY